MPIRTMAWDPSWRGSRCGTVFRASAAKPGAAVAADDLHEAVFHVRDEDAERAVALLNESEGREWAEGGR